MRVALQGDQCGDGVLVDVGSQPKDLCLAPLSPELALVAIDSGVVLLQGTKVVSTVNLGFTVTALAISPDGTEAIIGGQDGKLHIYSIKGDTLTEEGVLEKHRGAISVIRYSPDVSMFASGDLNREAVVWDRASREVPPFCPPFDLEIFLCSTVPFPYSCHVNYIVCKTINHIVSSFIKDS